SRVSSGDQTMDQNLFGGVPRFLTRPKAFSVCAGKDATLSCTIVGSPTPLITWEKDKLKLMSGGRFKTVEDGDVYRLTIYDLTLEDSGQYMCRAKNSVGEAYAAVTLKVALPTEMTQRAPVFMVKPTSTRVVLGGDVVFHCRVAAHPEANFEWEKDGRYLGETNRIKIASDGDISTLKIQSVRNMDAGTYTCRVQNAVGRAHAAAALTVDAQDARHQAADKNTAAALAKLPKGVFTRTCTVTEGKHAKLSCFVTGHPKPHIIWRKDGSNISEGRRHVIYEDYAENFILKILYCKQSDNGLYTCNATNMAGQTYSAVLVTVKEPKVPFRRKLQDVEVQEKTSATLLCEVPVVATQTDWFMEETRLRQSSKYHMEEDGTLRRLTIHNVTTNDDGVYICEMNEGSRTVAELTVLGNITKKLPRRTVVPVSDTVIFCVELEQPCADAYWTRNGDKLKEDARISIACVLRQYTLTIRDCQADDSGEVAFVAGDCKTSTPARKHPPDPPVDAVVRNKTDSSITIQWSPPDSDRPVPIKAYIVEKRKVGTQTWQRCNAGETIVSTEITICSFSEEASYQFRVSAMNDFGQSAYLEVPGSFYLEPTAEIRKGLTNSTSFCGEEFSISVELSAVCSGFWSLNGRLLRSGSEYLITRTKTTHTLIIRTVTAELNGTEVKFVGGGSQTSCILSESVQKEVKASLSQKASLSCEVADSKTEVKWYKDGKLLTSSKTIHTESKGKSRQLVLDSVEKQDSGEYVCEAGTEKLSGVASAELQVQSGFSNKESVQKEVKASLSQKASLSCEVADSKTEVKWYKDGKLLTSSRTIHTESKGKSRQLVLDSVEKKDAGEYVCEAGTEKLKFRLQLEGEAWMRAPLSVQKEVKASLSQKASLSCEVADSKTEVKWYKDGKLLTSSRTIHTESRGKSRQLVLDSVEKKDAGEYVCEAGTEKAVTSLTELPSYGVAFSNTKLQPRFQEVKAPLSQKATLSCEVSDPKMDVKWYKDGKLLTSSKAVHMESKGKIRELVIEKMEKKDAGEYTCEAASENFFFTDAAVKFQKKSVKDSYTVQASESIVLSAEVTAESATVRWFKDGVELKQSSKYEMKKDGCSRTLIVKSSESKDSGLYCCQTADDKLDFKVQVKGGSEVRLVVRHRFTFFSCNVGLKFVVPLKPASVELGGMLSLMCELNQTTGDVVWKRDGREIKPGGRSSIRTDGAKRILTVTGMAKEDEGEYSCECRNDKTSAKVSSKAPRAVRFTTKLNNVAATEGKDAIFKCAVNPSDASVKWFHNGAAVTAGSKYKLEHGGGSHSLTITSVTPKDGGEVSVDAEGKTCQASLQVQREPVTFKKKLENLTAEEQSEVKLEVELSKASEEVRWMKNSVVLQAGGNVEIRVNGVKQALVFKSVTHADRGFYSCETLDDKTQAKLTVESKSHTQHTVLKPLKETKAHETETVTMEVELSVADVEGSWTKDGAKLKPGDNVRLTALGKKHALTFSNLKMEDAGLVSFTAEGVHTSARLIVTEPPAMISKPIMDVSVPEKEKATFECEVSRTNADVRWFKNDAELKPGKNVGIHSVGRKRTLIISRCSSEDGGTYICRTADDNTSAKLTVKGNRRYYSAETAPVCVLVRRLLRDVEVMEKESASFVCEISHDEVECQWYKGSAKIKASDNVKLRQEGKTYVLLFRSVTIEDMGEIKFTAEKVSSTAKLKVKELPVKFVKKLRDKIAMYKHRVHLECQVSRASAKVRWYKNKTEIKAGKKYEIKSEDVYRKLTINDVDSVDEDTYTCDAADDKTSCKLLVEGNAVAHHCKLSAALNKPSACRSMRSLCVSVFTF
uniref:non-specific serine/threonine protein kinase n=1 Tax=Salarias fasciatus TaxID=181472 RepID=A0A672F418_SALFA